MSIPMTYSDYREGAYRVIPEHISKGRMKCAGSTFDAMLSEVRKRRPKIGKIQRQIPKTEVSDAISMMKNEEDVPEDKW